MTGIIITIIIVIIFLIIFITYYNNLIKSKNKIKESLGGIDVHLKLRFDLIPNLVKTVKGYATHEKEIFEKLINARKIFNNSNEIEEKINQSNEVIPEINNIIMLKESYPELKADKAFLKLITSLNVVEDKISAARRFYNSAVNEYNNKVEIFPSNLIAKMFSFKKETYFQININESENVSIKDINE